MSIPERRGKDLYDFMSAESRGDHDAIRNRESLKNPNAQGDYHC